MPLYMTDEERRAYYNSEYHGVPGRWNGAVFAPDWEWLYEHRERAPEVLSDVGMKEFTAFCASRDDAKMVMSIEEEAARLIASQDPRDKERLEQALNDARVCQDSRRSGPDNCFCCTLWKMVHAEPATDHEPDPSK